MKGVSKVEYVVHYKHSSQFRQKCDALRYYMTLQSYHPACNQTCPVPPETEEGLQEEWVLPQCQLWRHLWKRKTSVIWKKKKNHLLRITFTCCKNKMWHSVFKTHSKKENINLHLQEGPALLPSLQSALFVSSLLERTSLSSLLCRFSPEVFCDGSPTFLQTEFQATKHIDVSVSDSKWA